MVERHRHFDAVERSVEGLRQGSPKCIFAAARRALIIIANGLLQSRGIDRQSACQLFRSLGPQQEPRFEKAGEISQPRSVAMELIDTLVENFIGLLAGKI